jgi:hypothetical protein
LPAILGADPLRQQYHSRASFLEEQFSPAKLKDKIAPKKSWIASGRIRTLRNSSEYLEPDVSTDTLRGARRANLSINPSQSSTVKLPAIYQMRDNSINAASRAKFKKEISFIKIHYDYERYTRQTEEITTRHNMIRELRENYPDVADLSFDQIMGMDLMKLHQVIEHKKLESRMNASAIIIQRAFRNYVFRSFNNTQAQIRTAAALLLQQKWKEAKLAKQRAHLRQRE